MTGINERLAVVETQIESIMEAAERREEKQDEILLELQTTKKVLTDLQSEIMRYKGFFGGIVFVLSCMGAFLFKFAAPLYKLLSVKTGG